MPQGGGLTLKDASISPEEGCIYLYFGLTFVCKPTQLTIRGFKDDESWNYLFLELEELKPILTNDVDEEDLVEDTPAHYVDSSYAVYGVYDYDSGNKFPPGWKQVTRVCKGNFLIVSKGGFYNSITPTDDGRQSDFSEAEFFDYITAMKKDVDNAKNDTELSCVRHKYWTNPRKILSVPQIDKSVQKSDYDIREHLGDLNFSDLLDGTGDGYAKYYFTFDTLAFRSPFDFYKSLYLCKDGSIKKLDKNDDNIFYAYDKNKALSLLEQLNQRIADECTKHGVANANLQCWANIHCMMQKMPTHFFTYNELNKAILAADDRKDNVVCIDEEGHVVVACDVDYHIFPVSYERFGAFKNCVGPYSNGTAEYIAKDLCSLFLEYIKTGKEARYTEDSDNRDIKEIIRETKMLLNNYKDAAKALSIKNI